MIRLKDQGKFHGQIFVGKLKKKWKKHLQMKTKKNKYKEKDIEKRRKEWDKIRRETNNKKWMLWV